MTESNRKGPTQRMFADEETEVTQAAKPARKAASKKKEEAYEPPAQEAIPSGQSFVDLPSKGLLWYDQSITFRDIMVKDEEILATATAETYARTLNSVLKGILNDFEKYEQLAINDRDYLLVWLWANNYSSIKEVEVTCSNRECGEKHIHKVDLTKLNVTDLRDDVKVPFKIPLSKKPGESISVRHSIVADELAVEQFMSTKAGKEYSYDYLMYIASIDLGFEMMMQQKINWIRENVTGKEMSYVRRFHDYFAFGVQQIMEYSCPACKEVTRGPLPFQTEDVLFPTPSDDFEKLL